MWWSPSTPFSGSEDYDTAMFLIAIKPGEEERQFCNKIFIIDDVIVEENEVFYVILSSDDLSVQADPSPNTVTIRDNDQY